METIQCRNDLLLWLREYHGQVGRRHCIEEHNNRSNDAVEQVPHSRGLIDIESRLKRVCQNRCVHLVQPLLWLDRQASRGDQKRKAFVGKLSTVANEAAYRSGMDK